MSVESLITQHIDIWTSAVQTKSTAGRGTRSKLDLYGIKKLRDLILELAVRGKLVPQDPNDEPASVLLQRIAEAKAQLVKEKKIKKPKKSAEISDDEKPFDIPEEWKWIRLSEYAQIFSGNAFKSGDFSSEVGAKTIKITNAGVGHLIETDEYLPEEFLTTYSQYRVVKNDLILALTRPYISDGLKVSMCLDSYHNSLLNQRVAAIRAYVNPEYAFFILRSPYVLNTYKNRFSGSGLQPNLKMSDITELVIPICSEQEQHRIVAKVDELMVLCDQLEQQTEASIEAHQVLVETLLATLTNSANADELIENWERISAHFDTLFTTEESIDQLKQTILQLAVMGKLVAFGESKTTDLKSILSFGPRNGFSPKEVPFDTSVKVLKLGATSYGALNLDESKNVSVELEDDSHLLLRQGDILIQRGNTAKFVGSNVLINEDYLNYIYPDLMMKIRVNNEVIPEYISLYLSSSSVREHMWSQMTGTSGTMPKISKKIVESISVSYPTDKSIQMEVVKTFNSIVNVCEELRKKLYRANSQKVALAKSLVHQVVS